MATMIFCFLSLLLSYGVIQLEASHHIYSHLQTSQPVSTQNRSNDPYRTGYHFQPLKNWINDPNGPLIYKGIYHLFYQYNPKGVVWGNIVWAHSTSTDLVNWTPHDAAIYPSEPFDKFGCWSGSATILPDGTPAILYTGIINPQNEQVQNLAYPKNLSDPFLKEWVKVPQNPLMAPTQANQINGSSFRDPTTAWLGPDKRWRLIIGSKKDQRGLAILYRSRVGDLTRWTKAQHPLHSAANTGMWECPDFFPVSKKSTVGLDTSTMGPDVKHVLKVSLDNTRKEYYTIGTYYLGKGKDIYIPDEGSVESDSGLRYDYGKFYASKTFFDSDKNRRILWGWINESSSVNDDIKKGWSGLQAIPRTIVLDKSGKQLVQWPIVELEKLRTKKVELPSMLKGGSLREVFGVTPAQADVDATFEISDFEKAEVFDPSWTNAQNLCSKKDATVKGGLGPFGLFVLASKGMEEYTAVFYRIFKSDDNKNMNKYVVLMCSDQSRSSLNQDNDKVTYGAFVNVDPVHEKLSLRSLIDHSIVESFGGEGKACITARVYPTLAIDDKSHLYAFNYGSESVKITGSAWSLKTAQIS